MNDRFKFRVWCDMHERFMLMRETTIQLDATDSLECCTVEQCTGLKDKKGSLIFEGDIMKVYHFRDYTGCDRYMFKEIVWNTDKGCYYFKSRGETHSTLWVLLDNSDCKVIGNIHENPELLEDK